MIEKYGTYPTSVTRVKLAEALKVDEADIWPMLDVKEEVVDDESTPSETSAS
jgi:hypothetical protein